MRTRRTCHSDLTKRLPFEILAMIFQAWKDSTPRGKMYGLHGSWVRASWVCRRWRDVALGTPTLWSSVLVSRNPCDNAALAAQLDRAQELPLDLYVSSRDASERQVSDAFDLVLAQRKSIKKLTIAFDARQAAAVEAFVKAVGTDATLLSLLPSGPLDEMRWYFSQDSFPHLDRLVLSYVVPFPVPGAPLFSLTHLSLHDSVESFSNADEAEKPWTFVHNFLAACPNLQTLRTVDSFEYPLQYLDPHDNYEDLPIVTLPRLGHLAIEGLALDTSTALSTLRLPALSTFHITAFPGRDPYDCDFYVIPRSVSESLPPIRRSRCVSFIVGGHESSLTLRGGSWDPFLLWSDADWSVMIPDLVATHATSDFLGAPCCVRYNCARFLARLPSIVVPSNLVRLELHVADGLPILALDDFARFFGDMTHLRTLVIGSDKLIARVLEAFEADTSVCPELEELDLCLGEGPTCAEVGPLVEFITRTVGEWVRGRGRALQTLKLLVHIGSASDADDSASEYGSDADAHPNVVADRAKKRGGSGDYARSAHDAELAYMKLWSDLLATLNLPEGSGTVGEVRLKMAECAACNVEYEPLDFAEFEDGWLRNGLTYY